MARVADQVARVKVALAQAQQDAALRKLMITKVQSKGKLLGHIALTKQDILSGKYSTHKVRPRRCYGLVATTQYRTQAVGCLLTHCLASSLVCV